MTPAQLGLAEVCLASRIPLWLVTEDMGGPMSPDSEGSKALSTGMPSLIRSALTACIALAASREAATLSL